MDFELPPRLGGLQPAASPISFPRPFAGGQVTNVPRPLPPHGMGPMPGAPMPDSELHRAAVEGRQMVVGPWSLGGVRPPSEMQARQLGEATQTSGLSPVGTGMGRFNGIDSQPATSPLTHPYPLAGNGTKVMRPIDPFWNQPKTPQSVARTQARTAGQAPPAPPAPAPAQAGGTSAPGGKKGKKPKHRSHPIGFQSLPSPEATGRAGYEWSRPF